MLSTFRSIQFMIRCVYTFKGCEYGQTFATGCFKVTTRLPSWHGGWFILPATAQDVSDMKSF